MGEKRGVLTFSGAETMVAPELAIFSFAIPVVWSARKGLADEQLVF
jgi:hypothetical protein